MGGFLLSASYILSVEWEEIFHKVILLSFFYLLFIFIIISSIVIISACSKKSAEALVILLGAWICFCLILPKLSANLGAIPLLLANSLSLRTIISAKLFVRFLIVSLMVSFLYFLGVVCLKSGFRV